MTHDGLLRRVVGPREPGDLRALRTRRLPDGEGRGAGGGEQYRCCMEWRVRWQIRRTWNSSLRV